MKLIIKSVIFSSSLLLCLSSMAQTCPPSVERTQATEHFVVHVDGTVTDTRTGLMWMRCSVGQSATDCSGGNAIAHNWQQALQQAQDANASVTLGYKDWRLPSITELASLTELGCHNPAINEVVFPNTKNDRYWSSSPSAEDNRSAWLVYFVNGNGLNSFKDKNYYVRLVRGGN